MKAGLFGKIRQIKKPIQSLFKNETIKDPEDEWKQTFEHTLRGHITKVSGPPNTKESSLQFAVLYYIVENESPCYFIRVYYISNELNFEYKDLVLPGTTWIKSFTLEADSILISRDPDFYQYRILKLPDDITKAPHSGKSQDIILSASEHGHYIPPLDFSATIENHENAIVKLYSPISDTYRVLSFDYYKTISNFHVNVILADNASTVTQLSELRKISPKSTWQFRSSDFLNFTLNNDNIFEQSENLDFSRLQENYLRMPTIGFTRSEKAKTVVFPISRNQFMTWDYIDRVDLLKPLDKLLYRNPEGVILPEFYYGNYKKKDDFDTYNGDISGLQINDEGNLLAVWTKKNYIYIYKRGTGDDHVLQNNNENKSKEHYALYNNKNENESASTSSSLLPIKSLSLVDQLDIFLGIRPPLSNISPQVHYSHHPDLPDKWTLRMVITSNDDTPDDVYINTANFVNATTSPHDHFGNNYIFVALTSGAVHSYLVDSVETPETVGLISFITGQWDMLVAMCVIIAVFVVNEFQYYSSI
ncbi:unnamed protein product [Cunninghamella echinulata]